MQSMDLLALTLKKDFQAEMLARNFGFLSSKCVFPETIACVSDGQVLSINQRFI